MQLWNIKHKKPTPNLATMTRSSKMYSSEDLLVLVVLPKQNESVIAQNIKGPTPLLT